MASARPYERVGDFVKKDLLNRIFIRDPAQMLRECDAPASMVALTKSSLRAIEGK